MDLRERLALESLFSDGVGPTPRNLPGIGPDDRRRSGWLVMGLLGLVAFFFVRW